ncbi:unannotated protein [freshwater metagenome]|uniref:Unannotated protein n=1 Tax=freshwater metagenome TaxID=449393 RepID=A0A6J6TZB8_9ZZZZ|nr:hypothetical protein [Actinomycetota bacterium]
MFIHPAPPAVSRRPTRAFGIRAILAAAAGLIGASGDASYDSGQNWNPTSGQQRH